MKKPNTPHTDFWKMTDADLHAGRDLRLLRRKVDEALFGKPSVSVLKIYFIMVLTQGR